MVTQYRYQFPTGEQQIFNEEELKTPATQERLRGATRIGQEGQITSSQITSSMLKTLTIPPFLSQTPDTTNYDAFIQDGQGILEANKITKTDESSDLETRLKNLMVSIGSAPPSNVAPYEEAYQTSGLETARTNALAQEARVKSSQAKLAGIQAQIQSVIDKRNVQNLQLEKQASGGQVVTTVLNRQQQEINRQSAIEALPLQALALSAQAEVAAAQGDAEYAQSTLAMAQDKLNTAFKLRSDDITREYDYKKDARKAIYDFFTAEQKTRADAKQKEEDNKRLLMTNNLDNAQSIANTLMQGGQGELAAKVTQLDPKSSTFSRDLANLQKQVKETKPTGDITEFKAFFPNVDITTPVGRQQFLNWKAQVGAAGRKQEEPIVPGTISEITGKPLTEGERISRGFAERAVISSEIIDQIGPQFAGITSYLGQTLPNILKTSDRQRFEQAQRNFVNAILRRESGAVINPDEFVNARKQYFPQPGDKPEVITQKARNREVMIRTLQSAGGVLPFSGISKGTNSPEGLRTKYNY